MHFFQLNENSGINIGSIASYEFAFAQGETGSKIVKLLLYNRTEKILEGEQVERFARALPHFTFGISTDKTGGDEPNY